MNDFTILHLSDLHFVCEDKNISHLHKLLLNDIVEQLKCSTNILIVFTGDLFYLGAKPIEKLI